MSQQPQLTVSGYRGIWGESLTTDIAARFARAFATLVQEKTPTPTILIGRDGRESGLEIKKVVIATLTSLGVRVIDGDVLPTPTVLFAVRKHHYDGAIIITASHNPIEYNGLKFVMDDALFTDEEEVEKIKKYCKELEAPLLMEEGVGGGGPGISEIEFKSPPRPDLSLRGTPPPQGGDEPVYDFPREHADQILSHIDVEKIRTRKFKIAVDMINASACVLDPYLFEQLGAELIPLNNIPNGKFTHMPEPLAKNLGEIATLVKSSGANIGFTHDPDADRLVVVDERGEIISEELTLALGVEDVLSKFPGNNVVINMSTSQVNCDIAQHHGGKCIRTKVGEPNVVAGILENKAIIGGEGTGSSIYPSINLARDSFTSLALVLELISERNQTISQCVEALPHYVMRKDKMPVGDNLSALYEKMKSHFPQAQENELDGLRLDFADHSWIHLRPSNTEPIVRLYGEAKTQEAVDALFEETKKLF
jgi:phosphomannomutase